MTATTTDDVIIIDEVSNVDWEKLTSNLLNSALVTRHKETVNNRKEIVTQITKYLEEARLEHFRDSGIDISATSYSINIMFPPITFHKWGPCENVKAYIKVRDPLKTSRKDSLYMIGITQNWRKSKRHPHISREGNYCWAGASEVREAIEHGYYEEAIMILLTVVNTYIPDQAHTRPERSIPCMIDNCPEYGIYAVDLEKRYDEKTLIPHTSYVCAKHNATCNNCSRNSFALPEESANMIVKTGYCKRCTEASVCTRCGKQVPPSRLLVARFMPPNSTRHRNRKACLACQWKCLRCGVRSVIDIDGITLTNGTIACDPCFRNMREQRVKMDMRNYL